MTIRNLVIAAGAVLAAGSALAAPGMASAQEYRPIYREAPVYQPVQYGYGYERPRYDYRRIEAHRYWEHRRFERFHHEYRPYRGW